MLSMGSLVSAGQASSYYSKDNYYTAEAALETSGWAGEGAVLAGLNGPVGVEEFEAILEGRMPDGTVLGGGPAGAHAPGFDLTFSAPKSLSILAYVGGDERLLVANMAAVKATLAWAEKNLAETRIKKDGKVIVQQTGNLVAALFQHDTSRNLDPQAHIHAVIANATRDKDGQWRSLLNGKIWQNNAVLGSIYHAYLRAGVEKLGYLVEPTGKHGTFEIVGVGRDAIEAFSTRRTEILAANAKLDYQNPKTLDASTLTTRQSKTLVGDRDALHTGWRDRAAALGLNLGAVIEAANDRMIAADRPWTKLLAGAANARDSVAALADYFRQKLGIASESSAQTVDSLERLPSGKANAETVAAAQAVASAVRHLSERETSFDRFAVAKAALDLGLPVTIDAVDRQLNSLVANKALIKGVGPEKGKLTTPGAVRTETMILAEVEAGKGVVVPVIASSDLAGDRLQAAAQARAGFVLNAGQESAGRLLLASADRIVNVQGVAGAGKSSVLGAVADVARAEGRAVLALGIQNKLIQMLGRDTGIEAMTVAKFLHSHGQLLDEKTFDDRLAMARAMFRGAVLVVDEASMVSNDQALKLVALANRLEVGRLAFVGDKRQLGAVEAGKPFEVMQDRGTATALMPENLRARDPVLRAAAELADQGKPGAALALLGDKVTAAPGLVVETAAGRWLDLSSEDRDRTLLMTSGRRLMGELNDRVQAGLRQEGSLVGPGVTVTILDKVTTTREEERYARTYEAGLRVEFGRAVPSQHIEPGWATVTDVDHDKGIVTLVRDDGRAIRFQPTKLQSNRTENALRIGREREVQLHEGEKIRWTDTDRARGIYNADNAKILSITNDGVTVENAAGLKLVLAHGDPMLSRLDLGYAMNTHQLQGATSDRAIAVGESRETNLANGRLFLVNITRARDSLEVIVDDPERFARALDRNPGDKSSALDTSAGKPESEHQWNPEIGSLPRREVALAPMPVSPMASGKPRDMAGQTKAPVPVKQLDLGL